MRTKLVTSAYYNIKGHPHYGANRAIRLRKSLPNIAKHTNLPIVCYTSQKYGCYDELQEIFASKNITNVTLKIFELENHPLHEPILAIRKSNPEKYLDWVYSAKPIVVYWSKFKFMLEELYGTDYLYWIDAGLSHNGLFPKKYALGDTSCHGMDFCDSTYDFSCFSNNTFDKINKYTGDKVLQLVRDITDADLSPIKEIPELKNEYNKNLSKVNSWPVAGLFGGHIISSPLQLYLEKMQELFRFIVRHNYITVEEGVMAYVNVVHDEWFKRYHFENFYTEDEIFRHLHWKVNEHGVEDGSIYHHFYRLFCDTGQLVDCMGNT